MDWLDFEKAFVTVEHSALWNVPEQQKVPKRYDPKKSPENDRDPFNISFLIAVSNSNVQKTQYEHVSIFTRRNCPSSYFSMLSESY